MTRALTVPTLGAITKSDRPRRALRRVRAKLRRGWSPGTTPRCLPLSGRDLSSVMKGTEDYAREVIHGMREHAETWSPGQDGADDVQGVMLDEKREVFLHSVDLQIAQTATMLTLRQHLEAVFDPLNYAYRPRRSVHDALFAARSYTRRYPHAAKADIRKFFPNTTAAKVIAAFQTALPDFGPEWSRWIPYLMSSNVFRLGAGDVDIRGFVDPSWGPAPERRPHPGVVAGTVASFERQPLVVLQGSVLGPTLANIVGHVMVDVPLRALRPDVMCLRYADDILLLGRTPGVVEDAIKLLGTAAEQWDFQLHPEKTSTSAVDLRTTSMEWLGKELGQGVVRTPHEWVERRIAEALALPPTTAEARQQIRMLVRELRLDSYATFENVVGAVYDLSMDHYFLIEDLFPKERTSRIAWMRSSNHKMITP